MKRYAIWNKQDEIITPIGELLTAEQWMERHPVARLDRITIVCAAGEINGGFYDTLGNMVRMYESMGADFSECTTNEEILEAIEAFEDYLNTPVEDDSVSDETRIADALEDMVVLQELSTMSE